MFPSLPSCLLATRCSLLATRFRLHMTSTWASACTVLGCCSSEPTGTIRETRSVRGPANRDGRVRAEAQAWQVGNRCYRFAFLSHCSCLSYVVAPSFYLSIFLVLATIRPARHTASQDTRQVRKRPNTYNNNGTTGTNKARGC